MTKNWMLTVNVIKTVFHGNLSSLPHSLEYVTDTIQFVENPFQYYSPFHAYISKIFWYLLTF